MLTLEKNNIFDEIKSSQSEVINPEMHRVSLGKAIKHFDEQIIGHFKQKK